MELPKANQDTTYCNSYNCQTKCWRHIKNWKFDEDKNYWFITNSDKCEFKDKLNIGEVTSV